MPHERTIEYRFKVELALDRRVSRALVVLAEQRDVHRISRQTLMNEALDALLDKLSIARELAMSEAGNLASTQLNLPLGEASGLVE